MPFQAPLSSGQMERMRNTNAGNILRRQVNLEDDDGIMVAEKPTWLSKFRQQSKRHAKMRRVTDKNGFANVTYKNVSQKRRRYFSDIYTTLVDSTWVK
jgi:hypothetical protein